MNHALDRPTLVMIPCFAGAPWRLYQLAALQDWPMRTLRLPDELDDLERLADFVLTELRDMDAFVLVGDSFGAVISLAAAVRRPAGLQALVLHGISGSQELVLPRTGHMFRFSHPAAYSKAVAGWCEVREVLWNASQ